MLLAASLTEDVLAFVWTRHDATRQPARLLAHLSSIPYIVMNLDIVDASSIDTHFRTVQSGPPTSTEARFEPSASTHSLADDDHYQDIVWARLPGYIRPPTSDKLRA